MSDGEPSEEDGERDEDEAPEDEDDKPAALDPALIEAHNGVLDPWEASVDDDTRTAATESAIETGNVPEGHGLEQADLDVLYQGYVAQTAAEVLDQIGITAEEWGEHIGDEAAFRRDVLMGNWDALREHAKKAVVMRHEMGLPLSHRKWNKLARAG